jgi:hypothetical protein
LPFQLQPSTHTLSTDSLNTLNFLLLSDHGQIQQHLGTRHGRDAHHLCQQKCRHPAFTQGKLKEWLWTTHGVCVTQATISLTLKRNDELLVMAADTSVPPPRLALRTRQVVQYSQMELALKRWFFEQ